MEYVKIKQGFGDEGRTGHVIGDTVYADFGQNWTPIKWDDADDPDWHKTAGLSFSNKPFPVLNKSFSPVKSIPYIPEPPTPPPVRVIREGVDLDKNHSKDTRSNFIVLLWTLGFSSVVLWIFTGILYTPQFSIFDIIPGVILSCLFTAAFLATWIIHAYKQTYGKKDKEQ